LANQNDVRRIALSLPDTREEKGRFAFSVENKGKQKGFVWVWLERAEPRKPRVPRADVLAVRVRDQGEKALLIAGDPDRFFTETHYNGFPAVLVRLPKVTRAQLRKLILDAWRCQAPRELVARLTAGGHSASSRITPIRSDLPSKPMPGKSGIVTWPPSTRTPSGKPPKGWKRSG